MRSPRAASATTTTSSTPAHRRTVTTYLLEGAGDKMPWSAVRVLGLVAAPLMLLTIAVATPWAVDHIEGRLVDATRHDLIAAGVDPSTVEIDFDYRDGRATGSLPDGVSAAELERLIDHGLLRDIEIVAAETTTTNTAGAGATDESAGGVGAERGSTEVEAELIDGRLALTGTVPTEGQRLSLLGAAESRFGVGLVADEIVVSGLDPLTDGAEDRIADLVSVIEALSGAGSATVTLTDESLAIEASVADDATAASIRAVGDELTSVATTVAVDVQPSELELEIERLQDQLDSLADEIRETVVFEFESTRLSVVAQATLQKIVDAMTRYPRPVVEVVGHTDTTGDAALNQELSEDRAAAVEAYLVESGIAADRLRSRGAGDTEPIDTNDTVAGRAQNRRVALTALPSF